MKILLINDYATPNGGAELLTLMLRDGLRRRGLDARIFSSSACLSAGDSHADYECFGTTSRFRTLLQTVNPWAFWRLRQILTEFKPHVVHVNIFLTQLSPLILPLLRDIPSLYYVVWYRPICPTGTKMLPNGAPCRVPAGAVCYHNHCLPLRDWPPLMLQMKLWRRWSKAFDRIVAASQAVKNRLMAESIEPNEVIWNGVPIQPPRPPLSAPPTVAFAGRLVREKGIDVLLRAFAKVTREISEARLLLAGDGPERDQLKRLITSLKLADCVAMLGYIPRQEMERRFAGAWVQVIPSRWAEPFGLVAAEAMMRGTAVVASRSGGPAEIVCHGQTGLLVPPDDAEALAKALLHLLRTRDLAEQMGAAGRQRALTYFSETVFVDKFIQLYQKLARNRKV